MRTATALLRRQPTVDFRQAHCDHLREKNHARGAGAGHAPRAVAGTYSCRAFSGTCAAAKALSLSTVASSVLLTVSRGTYCSADVTSSIFEILSQFLMAKSSAASGWRAAVA